MCVPCRSLNILAASTSDGCTTFFRYTAPDYLAAAPQDLAKLWQQLPTTCNLNDAAMNLQLGPSPRLVAIACKNGEVYTCRQAPMKYKVSAAGSTARNKCRLLRLLFAPVC